MPTGATSGVANGAAASATTGLVHARLPQRNRCNPAPRRDSSPEREPGPDRVLGPGCAAAAGDLASATGRGLPEVRATLVLRYVGGIAHARPDVYAELGDVWHCTDPSAVPERARDRVRRST
jgi:hypothetical protein